MNFWLCVSAAAIVIAGSYIIWGPSNRPKRKKKGIIPGLQNLGNSCFLNAVLQALSACPSVITWLHKVVDYSTESQQDDKCILTKSLLSILSALNESDDNCSGAEVIKALRTHRWIISNEEQDAHELFHVLTTTIEEEALALTPVLSLLDTKKLEMESEGVAEEHRKSYISSMKALPMRIASPMRGLLVNELKCNSCHYKYPARYDTFDSISLVIPTPNWGDLTLQDLLLKFISCELVQDVVCDGCSKEDASPVGSDVKEKEKTTFNKQLSFGKLPKCLCIHVQRTVWLNNGIPVKCYDYISFPKVLIMDHFVHSHRKKDKQLGANYTRLRLTGGNSSKNDQITSAPSTYPVNQRISKSSEINISMNKILPLNLTKGECLSSYNYVYSLKAVIVHQGDTSSGHFITYRRVVIDNEFEKWFCVSDLDVKEVTFTEVSRSCAYMLFYEKTE